MDVVLDTNVLACFLLGVPGFRDEAGRAIEHAEGIWAPDLLRVEMANVLWQCVRENDLAPEAALAMLDDAEALVGRFVSSDQLCDQALLLALERDHPVYDTLFVALARSRHTVVVTYDQRLRRAFPEDVQPVSEFLSQAS